jgi:hypothetical protein
LAKWEKMVTRKVPTWEFARRIIVNSARGFLNDDLTRGPPFARARRAPNFVKDARAIA